MKAFEVSTKVVQKPTELNKNRAKDEAEDEAEDEPEDEACAKNTSYVSLRLLLMYGAL